MDIKQTTLATGLRVITVKLPGFRSASVAAFVDAGARDETAEIGGIAHFLEHMAFKGTTSRSAVQIVREIEELGADINAGTSHEMTAFHVNGLGSHFPKAIAILGDVLTHSVFSEADIEVEKGVILQEIAMNEDDPMSVAFDQFGQIAFPGQALGRPILGHPDFIQSVTQEHLRQFIGAHYNTNSIVVVGAGAIEHTSFVALVEEHFVDLPKVAVRPARALASYVGGLAVNDEKPFEQVNAIIGFPTVNLHAPNAMATRLMASLFGGGMSSPLFQEIREKRGLVYTTGAFSQMAADHGLMMIHAGMAPENLVEFLDVSMSELAKIACHRHERDLIRAKNTALVALKTTSEKPFNMAEFIAEHLFFDGKICSPDEEVGKVEAVTMDDIHAAAQAVLSGHPAISLVGPPSHRTAWHGFSEKLDISGDLRALDAIAPLEHAHLYRHTQPSRLEVLNEWEGAVVAVDSQAGTFTARLCDLTNNTADVSEAEFNIRDVSANDIGLLKVGGVFRWMIGYRKHSVRPRERVSVIVFRRLPVWTADEIEAAATEGERLAEKLHLR